MARSLPLPIAHAYIGFAAIFGSVLGAGSPHSTGLCGFAKHPAEDRVDVLEVVGEVEEPVDGLRVEKPGDLAGPLSGAREKRPSPSHAAIAFRWTAR